MSREDEEAWRATAHDLVIIWQSELASLLEDREAIEHGQAVIDGWARLADAMIASLPKLSLEHSRPDAPAGTAPAAASPDPRDVELARLTKRVAELERRLSEPG